MRRPWWKKRRVRYIACLVFGLLGPLWCPLLPWEPAQQACAALAGVARVLSTQVAPSSPITPLGETWDAGL